MKRVVLDSDVGTDVDDALAIAFALASENLQLEGVTTVHADAPLRARIAQRLLALAGRPDIPVIAGASVPLAPALPLGFHWPPVLWGHEGEGVLTAEERIPTVDREQGADDAARFIIERAAAAPGEISVVTIGPLTNLARALRLEPRLADWIGDVTIMGGMVDATRVPWPPVLETNLNADPLAAQTVFASRIPITLVGFEVTTQVFLTPDQRAEVHAWQHPLSDALVAFMERMLERFKDFSHEQALPADIFQGGRIYMHDPLAVYCAASCRHVSLRRMHVALEVHDQVLRTIAHADQTPNMHVCVGVDAPAFVQHWLWQVGRLTHRAGGVRERYR
jgi:purine nucleosidase